MKTSYVIHTCFFAVSVFIALSFAQVSYGQQVVSKQMPFLKDLPFNSVFTLYQDKSGYIWIGTYNGIARYDGYSLQRFSNDFTQPSLLTSNDVRCFTEDEHFIWAGTVDGITLIDKQNYQTHPFPDGELQKGIVQDLFRDHHGRVWVGGRNVIYRCNSLQGIVKSYALPCHSNSFFEDKDNRLWVVGTKGYILYYDETSDRFVDLPQRGNSNIYRMIQDDKGRYWLATWGDGLWSFNPQASSTDGMFQSHPIMNPVRGLKEQVFYDIIQDDVYGYLWALSHFRLYILQVNEQGGLEEIKSPNILQAIDLYKSYSRIIKDYSGSLWISAFDQGNNVCFYETQIENFILDNMNETLGLDPNIIYLNKDSKGVVWFDQARFGLSLYDEQTGKASYNSLLYNIDVRIILPSRDGSFMWLGGRETYSHKIWRAVEKDMHISLLEEIDLSLHVRDVGDILQLAEDSVGGIYIATTNELLYCSGKERKIEKIVSMHDQVTDMSMNRAGKVFLCCKSSIYCFKDNTSLQNPSGFYLQSILLPNEELKSCCAEGNGKLWITTDLGRLLSLDTLTGNVTDQTQACNLTGNEILKIACDKDEWLYVVCSKCIVKHDLKGSRDNFVYSVNDANIFVTSFRHGAAFVDSEGTFYAGGHKGFIKINRESQALAEENLQVCITDVKALDQSLFFTPSADSQANSNQLVYISPDQRNIEIHFSSFVYKAPHRIKYAYCLEGMEKEWTIIENGKNVAFYNKLKKGNYKFRVKSTDVYGRWLDNEQCLALVRLPAWYETWIAYIIYVLLGVSLISLVLWAYMRHLQTKNKIRLQKELAQIRLNYFTGISHELLTPLTIISCAVDALHVHDSNANKQIGIMQDNVNRLKKLIQQILDSRKLESGKMLLSVNKINISTAMQSNIAGNFQPLAHKKNIRLIAEIENGMYGYVDSDKLDKILFNLLSNAIKYTPEGRRIHFSAKIIPDTSEGYMLYICVADEGIGIAADELPHIFNRFYSSPHLQGYESTGIGLALTKELVSLHHGSILVHSKVNEGTTFEVRLPIMRKSYAIQECAEEDATERAEELTPDAYQPTETEENLIAEKPTLLLVDDNTDLLNLMDSIFREQYNVVTVPSGEEGLAALTTYNVDIIVCDLMMPGMSGTQLCEAIKQNPQTGHIPIIMLTAWHDVEGQVDSYRMGVDSFLTKPFDIKVLQARIDNLLQACKQRRETFQLDTELSLQNIDYRTDDKDFLQQAIHCVEKHIQDSDFDIVQMASELCMSRSTLSRKLKALTGLTPLDFVRNIKLKYACMLLKKQMGVAEATYAIGLSSPKYFTKCFKEAFGITPSEYQLKSLQEDIQKEKMD